MATVKSVASALSIGSGGSAGPERPIVQIGSAIASGLGQIIKVSTENLKLLVACGAAAGVSATFSAPIAGALFASEVILREFDTLPFTSVVLASVTATAISRAALAEHAIFQIPACDLASPG